MRGPAQKSDGKGNNVVLFCGFFKKIAIQL
jgi:hypothetical protein